MGWSRHWNLLIICIGTRLVTVTTNDFTLGFCSPDIFFNFWSLLLDFCSSDIKQFSLLIVKRLVLIPVPISLICIHPFLYLICQREHFGQVSVSYFCVSAYPYTGVSFVMNKYTVQQAESFFLIHFLFAGEFYDPHVCN
jgi:hypothetical protein